MFWNLRGLQRGDRLQELTTSSTASQSRSTNAKTLCSGSFEDYNKHYRHTPEGLEGRHRRGRNRGTFDKKI